MVPVELLKFAPVADPASEVMIDLTEVLALRVYDGCGESAMVRLSPDDAARIVAALTPHCRPARWPPAPHPVPGGFLSQLVRGMFWIRSPYQRANGAGLSDHVQE